jgi:hypothetical protein
MKRIIFLFSLLIFTNVHCQNDDAKLRYIKSEFKSVLFGNNKEYDDVFNQLNWLLSDDSIYNSKRGRNKFVDVKISYSDSILDENIYVKCLINSKGKCLKIFSNEKDFSSMDMLVNYLVLKKDKSCKSFILDVCKLIKMEYDTILTPSHLFVVDKGESKIFNISLFSYGEQNIMIDLTKHYNSYQETQYCKALFYLRGIDLPFDSLYNCIYSTNYLVSINPNKIVDKEIVYHYD